MVYANDQWVLLPVRDLYDSQIMAMAINAAKDMYEKGLLEIKDFTKLYGDFYSPVPGRTEEVYNETLGKVKNVVDAIYAAGGDPLRSPEARALISRAINGVDVAKINDRKREALAATDYIKSREAGIKSGTWNPDYERFMLGGQLLEEWDGSLGSWKATSTSPYKDLNNRYHHLFDNMTLSYDEEESKKMPGWIVKTKSKKDMLTIMDANLVDLKADPQYQYDHKRILDQLKVANPLLSDIEASNKADEILKNEIIDRNHEISGRTIEADPYYQQELKDRQAERLAAIQHRYKMEEDDNLTANNIYEQEQIAKINQKYPKPGSSKSSGSESGEDGVKDHMGALMKRGVDNYYKTSGGITKDGKLDTAQAAKNIQKLFRAEGYETAKNNMILTHTIHKQFDPQTVIHGITEASRAVSNRENSIYLSEDIVDRLYTDDDITANTLGVPRQNKDWEGRNKKDLPENVSNSVMEVTSDGITLFGKDYRMHLYVKVNVYVNGVKKPMYLEFQRGMKNAGSVSGNKYDVQHKPAEYEWDPDDWGYYNAQHVRIESYLKNNKAERIGEE